MHGPCEFIRVHKYVRHCSSTSAHILETRREHVPKDSCVKAVMMNSNTYILLLAILTGFLGWSF
jgi:hypothetical protein